MDTPRNVNPVTFMSNMLYACSILYKSKLPFVIVMNKVIPSLNVFNSPDTVIPWRVKHRWNHHIYSHNQILISNNQILMLLESDNFGINIRVVNLKNISYC